MASVNQAIFVGAILFASVQHVSGAYACPTGYKSKTPDGTCDGITCSPGQCCDMDVCSNQTCTSTQYRDLSATTAAECCKDKVACATADCTSPMALISGAMWAGASASSYLTAAYPVAACCDRECTADDCTTPHTAMTSLPKCTLATGSSMTCGNARCCKVTTCSDYTCPAAPYEKISSGSCQGSGCTRQDCCQYKNGTCAASQPACPTGEGLGALNTMATDTAGCCVTDIKCADSTVGTASGAVGTDIAGSALLLLIALAVV